MYLEYQRQSQLQHFKHATQTTPEVLLNEFVQAHNISGIRFNI